MTVSIVTVCRNSAATIADAISSVAGQRYPDIEHVIVDGNSSDGTPDIVERSNRRAGPFVSEPDRGIYDAMNKGIGLSSGEIVGFLNADDTFADDEVVERIVAPFGEPGIECVFGDLVYVQERDPTRVLRTWKPGPFNPGAFSRGWHPPHPTFYTRKESFHQYGAFDTSLAVSADFELMLRFLERHHLRSRYVPHLLVRMRTGGVSNRSFRNMMIGNRNCVAAFRRNGMRAPLLYPLLRLAPKLSQFITNGK